MVQTDVCKEKTLQYQLLGQIHRDASGKWPNIWAVVPFWLQRRSVLVLLAWLDEPIRFQSDWFNGTFPEFLHIKICIVRMVSQKLHDSQHLHCFLLVNSPVSPRDHHYADTARNPTRAARYAVPPPPKISGVRLSSRAPRRAPRRAVSVKKRAEQGQKPPVNGQ